MLEPCHQGIFKFGVLWVANSLDIFGSLTLSTHNYDRIAKDLIYCGRLHVFTICIVKLMSNCLLTPTKVSLENAKHLSLVLHCQTNLLSLITYLHFEM